MKRKPSRGNRHCIDLGRWLCAKQQLRARSGNKGVQVNNAIVEHESAAGRDLRRLLATTETCFSNWRGDMRWR